MGLILWVTLGQFCVNLQLGQRSSIMLLTAVPLAKIHRKAFKDILEIEDILIKIFVICFVFLKGCKSLVKLPLIA